MSDYYVYVIADAEWNPRYVGKGKGRRAYDKSGRNAEVSTLLKSGRAQITKVAEGLSEAEAFEIEGRLINL
jgi:hypothetical protein